jgi:hypothetical protein
VIAAYRGLDVLEKLQAFQVVRELLDSTDYRRFYQLVAYYERELGGEWPSIVERVAGGGMVVALKYGADPAPVLLVIQGTDEAAVQKFFDLTLQVVEQELARQESKEKVERANYRDVSVVAVGKEFRAAVVGSALVVSNKDDAIKMALDLHRDGPAASLVQNPKVEQARQMLPAEPLAFLWANLEPTRQLPMAKEAFELPRDFFPTTVLLGGYLDVIGRAPFVAVGLHQQDNALILRTRLPAGRKGLPEGLAVHVPPAGQPGTRGLLEPKNVLFSTSFYLDLGKFWTERAKLFTKQQVKDFEQFDQTLARNLAGTKFSDFLTWSGAYHRFVSAAQTDYGAGYTTKPKQPIPAFAFVSEMRDPERFGKGVEGALRLAALAASTQVGLKLVEEKHGDFTLITYRFPENRRLPNDTLDLRFNFSPCFVVVGNQFVASSTVALGRELIEMLAKEAKAETKKGANAAVRTRLYGAGVAAVLQTVEPNLLTQAILDQALPPSQAKEEVKKGLELLRQLGPLQVEDVYGNKEFRLDIRLNLGKKK